MALKRGRGRRKVVAEALRSDAPCRPVHAGISAVPTPFLDETIAFWQPHSDRALNREDAREIIHNISGFFAVLAEWEKAERASSQETVAPPVKTRAARSDRLPADDA